MIIICNWHARVSDVPAIRRVDTCRCEAFALTSIPGRVAGTNMRVGMIKAGPADERTALPAAEGVLLWSMRAWVLARCRTEELHVEGRIEAALDSLDSSEAGCGLCGFMEAVEHGGMRPIVVGPLCARRLTADEQALLGVFTCAQSGRAAEAAQVLRGMVASAAVGIAMELAADVALALESAGHRLAAPRKLAGSALESRPALH